RARSGPRPVIWAGPAATAGGMFWFAQLTEHAGYTGQLLGPILVTSSGLGQLFVPLALIALHNVAEQDAGVAASLLNTGQQVGGAIGLAALGTIAWTTVAENLRNASAAIPAPRRPHRRPTCPRRRCPPGSPAGSWSRQESGCSPCSSRSPPSGSAARI